MADPSLLKPKAIELGSGIGFLGLFTAALQKASGIEDSTVVLTDFDELVLEKLEENVRQSQSPSRSLLCAATANSPSLCILDDISDVAVKRLDWMDALEDPATLEQEVAAIDPDIILAADVVRPWSPPTAT